MPAAPAGRRRPPHAEPPEIQLLRDLSAEHPELAPAVDLQLDLLDHQRRVQARMPVPWIDIEPASVKEAQQAGRPLLPFENLPLDWTEFRLLFRQMTDALRRHEAIEDADEQQLQHLLRSGLVAAPLVRQWYLATSADPNRRPQDWPADAAWAAINRDALDQVLALAIRPFLERCAEVLQQRVEVSSWGRAYCWLCGGEPDFALITPRAERHLLCSRCTARWPFDPLACPFCGNGDRHRITSFASRDGRYRLYACDECRRYLKAYDGRTATRPLLLAVDTVATLPLDAAAMERGYRA